MPRVMRRDPTPAPEESRSWAQGRNGLDQIIEDAAPLGGWTSRSDTGSRIAAFPKRPPPSPLAFVPDAKSKWAKRSVCRCGSPNRITEAEIQGTAVAEQREKST